MHDVFIVISEGWGGGHVVRTVYAADHDDARETHRETYADEPIVAVHHERTDRQHWHCDWGMGFSNFFWRWADNTVAPARL